jgi:hypothetical protein
MADVACQRGSQSEFRVTGVTHPSVDELSVVNEAWITLDPNYISTVYREIVTCV